MNDYTVYFIDKDNESIHKERILCKNQRDVRILSNLRARELSVGDFWKFRVFGITSVLAATSLQLEDK